MRLPGFFFARILFTLFPLSYLSIPVVVRVRTLSTTKPGWEKEKGKTAQTQ